MKVDVFNRKQQYLNWKERVLAEGIEGLTKENSSIIIQYVLDMEVGRNIAKGSVKGGRGFPRLCNISNRLTWIARKLQDRGIEDLRACDEQIVLSLFSDMERGVLLTLAGKPYKSYRDYGVVFKSFWHWWMKVNRKQGKPLPDITEDIPTGRTQPRFVYLTKEQLDRMLPFFEKEEQTVLLFLFDSLVRSPSEVLSLQVEHIHTRDDDVCLSIPDEISKTFGRTLNLLYSGQAVLDHIAQKGLGPSDRLFSFKPENLNKKFQTVAVELFGDVRSHPQGDYFRNATPYDLRHSGAVHFRLLSKENPGIISLDAVRHRGGWTDMKMLNYYTQFLGLDGMIEKQGMLLRKDKHKLEREVDQLRNELAEIKAMNSKIMQLAKQGLSSGGELAFANSGQIF